MSEGGKLEFTLGLATGQFLSALGPVGATVKGLIASIGSIGGISAGVFSQIEKGADLQHLSKRSDESVDSLYKLEKGFKAVGLGAEGLPQVLFQMQKSLGGVNEMGMPTRDIFAGLGLDLKTLKNLDAAQALGLIADSMARLNKNAAAKASSEIIGRAAAGDMLQLARSGEEFAAALEKAGPMAALMARNAKVFADLELSIGAAKNKLGSFFAGIAEGAAPAIKRLVDQFEKIDLGKFGGEIGKMIDLVRTQFEAGKLGDIIGLTVEAGLIGGLNVFGRAFQALVASWPALMSAAVKAGFSIGGYAKSMMWELRALDETNIGMGMKDGADKQEHYKLSAKYTRLAEEARGESKVDFEAAIKKGAEATKAFFEAHTTDVLKNDAKTRLQAMIDALPKHGAEERTRRDGDISTAGLPGRRHLTGDVDALTRIGGFSTSGNSIAGDHARKTAFNTAQMLVELKKFNETFFGVIGAGIGRSTKNQ